MRCPNCKTRIQKEDLICGNCGAFIDKGAHFGGAKKTYNAPKETTSDTSTSTPRTTSTTSVGDRNVLAGAGFIICLMVGPIGIPICIAGIATARRKNNKGLGLALAGLGIGVIWTILIAFSLV